MKPLIDIVIQYISPNKGNFVDFFDRCCCRYTPLLLAVFMFITGTIDTFGKPINCMTPSEFPGTWVNFVHQFCYVSGTYLEVIAADGGKEKIFVDYYQWVPYILIIQAIALRIPLFFWRLGLSTSEVDFAHVHDICAKIRKSGELDNRAANVKAAANYIYQVAKHRGFINGLGSRTIRFYILFKLMNVLTVLLQIFFLTTFVGYRNPFWGITLARQVWAHTNLAPGLGQQPMSMHSFSYFPRVAYCDFGRDFLGVDYGELEHTVRCAIGINMLNEKVFLVLYFCYYFLLASTILHLIWTGLQFRRHVEDYNHMDSVPTPSWVEPKVLSTVTAEQDKMMATPKSFGMTLEPMARNRHSHNYVNNNNGIPTTIVHTHSPIVLPTKAAHPKRVAQFSQRVLGSDGLLLFRFVQQNFGKLVMDEISSALFHQYMEGRMMPRVSAEVQC